MIYDCSIAVFRELVGAQEVVSEGHRVDRFSIEAHIGEILASNKPIPTVTTLCEGRE
jgi:hypothetical protein